MTADKLGEDQAKSQTAILDVLGRLRARGWLPDEVGSTDLSASLSALIVAFNVDKNLNGICEALPYKKEGIDLVDLLNSMVNLGFVGRPASVRFSDIDKRLLPCLFIPDKLEDNTRHGMVVMDGDEFEDLGDDERVVFDGASEKVIMMSKTDNVSGVAYFFQSVANQEEDAASELRNATGFSWFRTLLGRFKKIFWQVLVISIMLNIISLSVPLFVMLVYDRVISAHSMETLYYFTVGVGIALAIEWVLRVIRSRSVAWFGARLGDVVSNAVFEHLLFLPSIYTERATVASQVARLKAFETVRDFFTGSLFLLLLELPFTLVIICAIFFIAGPLGWIPLVMGLLYMLLLLCMQPKLKAAMLMSAKASSARRHMNIETFEKMQALRSNGLTSMWFKNFRELSGRASLASFQSSFIASVISAFSHALFGLTGLATIVLGVNRIWAGEMTMGALIATMILIWRVLSPIQTFCNSVPRFEQVKNAIKQVNRLMSIKQERRGSESVVKLSNLKGGVDFIKVGLRYTKDKDPVFSGLTFSSEPGQMVAITGSNGSGKSTILKLVNGLYRPQAGSIRIDGVDIRQFDPQELRRRIAYVPQTPAFFQGTIAENLRFGRPLADDEVLESALRQVNAWEELSSLSNGINTYIGGNQSNEVSVNLLYRLNMARAFVKNASLMLFDEIPYSILNSSTGDAFRSSLKNWKGNNSVVMVTHREDYLKLADVVILLRTEERPVVGKPDYIINEIRKNNEWG